MATYLPLPLNHSFAHEIQNDNERMETELTKMKATLSSSTTTTGIFGPHSCDKDWKSFNGHRYLAVLEKEIWNDAPAFCESRQSYLIEVTTDEEFEFANENYRYPIWTGATDNDMEGTFVCRYRQKQVPEKYWRLSQIKL